MRTTLLASLILMLAACTTKPNGNANTFEARTHTVAPWKVERLPEFSDTIQTTVAPEDWNEEGSPHRISFNGNELTIRTTEQNHEAIFKYLNTVLTKP